MLLFIFLLLLGKKWLLEISIQLLLLFLMVRHGWTTAVWNFNTTLVTVYQDVTNVATVNSEFQYNSCYCLSNAFKPFFHFIIASFPDKINVSLNISQPSSIFSHFSPIPLQMAILCGLYVIINFIGWKISIPYRAERATRRVWNTVCPLVWHFDQFYGFLSHRCKASKMVKMDVISTG